VSQPVDQPFITPQAPEGDLLDTAAAGGAAVRGGAIRLGAYVAASLVALGAGALLYRHLGVIVSGRYTTVLSLIALVATASDLGLTAIGIRELSVRTGDARARIASGLLGLRLTITAIGIVGVTIFAEVSYGSEMAAGVLLAGVGLVFLVWQGTLAIPLIVGLRLGWTSFFEFLRQLLLSLLIVAAVLAGAHLLPFLAIQIPANLIVLLATIAVLRGQVPLGIRLAPREWREMLAPIVAYAAATAAAALYFRIAILLVSLLSNGIQLGYFSLSFNVMAALFVIPGLLVGVAFPIFSRAARDDHERLAYGIERVFEVCMIVGAWASLAIAIAAPLLIRIIGGPKFAPAADVLAIQGISVGAVFVGSVWGFGLLSLERHRTILYFNLAALAAVFVTAGVGASVDGARGAAIGTSAVELANAVIGLRLLTHGARHLHPSLRVVPKVALALALSALPVLLPVPEIVQLVLSGLVYVVVLLALRAFPRELLDLLPQGGRHRPGGGVAG
jgi:PST family polysaccharide transporter